jgi:hypothetical protein
MNTILNFVTAILITFISYFVGLGTGSEVERDKAAKAGVGYYKLVDQSKGKTEWVYGCSICASNVKHQARED